METSTATVTVLTITPVEAGRMIALEDVEILLDGVPMVIHGVQVRADASHTEITLPTYWAADGEWRAAVTLPQELRGAIGDAVIAAGIEAGVLQEQSPIG